MSKSKSKRVRLPDQGSSLAKKFTLRVKIYLTTISLLGLVLRMLLPLNPIFNSPHDDAQGIHVGYAILMNGWVPNWYTGNTTLVKGPGYGIFLALASLIPFALTTTTYLIYLFLSFKISRKLFELSSNFYTYLILVTLLVFNPAVFSNHASRAYRINLTPILVLASLYFVISLMIYARQLEDKLKSHPKGLSENLSKSIVVVFQRRVLSGFFLLGMTYGIHSITREDAVWTLPIVIFPIFYWVLRTKILFASTFKFQYLKYGVVIILVFLMGDQIVVKGVQLLNYQSSKSFLVEDLHSGNFPKALKIWASVEAGPERELVPVTKEKREAVYLVSSSARMLKPFLETPPDTGWKHWPCITQGICDESGAGWFPFELRDAAVAATGVTTEKSFQEYFGKLFGEISLACKSQKIECGPEPLTTYMGKISTSDLPKISAKFLLALHQLIVWQNVQVGVIQNPKPTEEQASEWSGLVNGIPSFVMKGQKVPISLEKFISRVNNFYSYLSLISPILLLLSFLGVVQKSTRKRRKGQNYFFWIVTFILASVIFRCLILAVLDQQGSPMLKTPEVYFLPSWTLMLILVSLGLSELKFNLPWLLQKKSKGKMLT